MSPNEEKIFPLRVVCKSSAENCLVNFKKECFHIKVKRTNFLLLDEPTFTLIPIEIQQSRFHKNISI
jgi:hypothetical protein